MNGLRISLHGVVIGAVVLAVGCAQPRSSEKESQIPSGAETARKASEASIRSEDSDEEATQYLTSSEPNEKSSNPYRHMDGGSDSKKRAKDEAMEADSDETNNESDDES